MNLHRSVRFLAGAALGALAIALAPTPAWSQDPTVDPQPARSRPGGGGGERIDSRRSMRVVPFDEVRVASPNGQVVFTLLPNAEQLSFTVKLGEAIAIERSAIRFQLDGFDLSSGVVLAGSERYEVDETYPWYGVKSTAVNRARGVRLKFTHDLSLVEYTLDVRVFDEGVAYSHVIPGAPGAARVPDERSEFVVPAGATAWFTGLSGHYEAPYERKAVSEIAPGEWAAPPVTMKLPNNAGYVAITEANLADYAGMALEADGRRGWVVGLGHRHPLNYPFELRYGREEGKRLAQPAAIAGTITTPWRVVMLGRDLNALVNSTILANLCPPPDPKYFPQGLATPWIKPGRAVWRYIDGGPEGFDGMKEFARLAGQLGFEHHVIEGFWRRWTPEQQKELVEYSRAQGVSLWFWRHSNALRTPEAREEFFKLLHELGVAGAKIDFMDHESKELVDLYEELLRKAAEYRVMINFHGSNKPSGRERTWPNDMVREGIRGMESRTFPDRARHQATLPFTRYLAGAADYTTMTFNERRRDSSEAHQIATMAVFASPLLTIVANPETILAHPAVDVIKSIPAVWDETRVLPGSEIGELAVYARRKGDTWFLAALAGPGKKSVRVPLSFLGDGVYQAKLVRDPTGSGAPPAGAPVGQLAGPDEPARFPPGVKMEDARMQKTDTIALELEHGGGFVARFTKAR